jgi:hypothetical protein
VCGVPPWLNDTVLLPDSTSTMPGACSAESRYSKGLMRPSGWPATWSARATIPANSGVASRVPQVGYHPAGWPLKLWYMSTAPLQAPLIEMSGTPRLAPTIFRTPLWYQGRPKTTDLPPPPASGFGPASPMMNSFVAAL